MGFLKKVAQAVAAPVQAVAHVAAPVINPVANVVEAINPISLAQKTPILSEGVALADKATGGLLTNTQLATNTPTDFLQGQNITQNLQASLKVAPAAVGTIIAGPQGAIIANQLTQAGFSKDSIASAGMSWLSGTPVGQSIKGIIGDGQDALNFWNSFRNPSDPNAYASMNDPMGLQTVEGYDTGIKKNSGPNILVLGAIGYGLFKLFR